MREQARRRTLLLSLGVVILASVSPVFGHHFAAGLERTLTGRDHLGPVCLIALHDLLAPVHLLFHVLVLAGLSYASFGRVQAWRKMRNVLGCLPVETAAEGDPFWTAAGRAGVQPAWVRVVPGLPNPAFTAGWLRPRIYVASELADRLDPDELTTVLAHEGAHALRRDPLRLSALRFLADTLFWIPVLGRIADDIADETEVLADDQASRDHPLALASAILALARWIRPPNAAPMNDVVGFAQRADLLDRRIRRLAGQEPEAQTHLTRRSVAGAVGALCLVWVSGAMMIHPLPTAATGYHHDHCSHPNTWAISHLFCGWSGTHASPDRCPHSV